MFNTELANLIMKRIETNPATWNQKRWACRVAATEENECGTAYCFAGHTVTQEGWQCIINMEYSSTECIRKAEDGHAERDFIEEVAKNALGVSGNQSLLLFNENNTMDDLKVLINHFSSHVGGTLCRVCTEGTDIIQYAPFVDNVECRTCGKIYPMYTQVHNSRKCFIDSVRNT